MFGAICGRGQDGAPAASPQAAPTVILSTAPTPAADAATPVAAASAAMASPSAAAPIATPTATPEAAPTPAATPAALETPAGAGSPAATAGSSPSGMPTLLKKTGVKLLFLPPPMEGTISLGIYDSNGKLVRVLHREAGGDEFVAAVDGYITHWDGTDDAGTKMPAGSYRAKGYMVGAVLVKPVGAADSVNAVSGSGGAPVAIGTLEEVLPHLTFPGGKAFAPQGKIRLSLVQNALDRDRAGSAEVTVGFDAKGSWLQLADGLPLKTVSATVNLKWAAIGRLAPGEPLIVYQSDGASLQEFAITKVANMMAFDCGEFELEK